MEATKEPRAFIYHVRWRHVHADPQPSLHVPPVPVNSRLAATTTADGNATSPVRALPLGTRAFFSFCPPDRASVIHHSKTVFGMQQDYGNSTLCAEKAEPSIGFLAVQFNHMLTVIFAMSRSAAALPITLQSAQRWGDHWDDQSGRARPDHSKRIDCQQLLFVG